MDHQTVLAEYLYERISPRHAAGLLEQRADNDVELYAAKAWIIFPIVFGLLDDKRLYRIFCEVILLMLVKGLPAITKQPAESLQRCLRSALA